MIKIVNYFSLALIFISLMIAVIHPKIKFPFHVDMIMLSIAIGSVAILINTTLGFTINHMQNAEVWLRFGFACLTARFVFQCARGGK